MNFRPFGIYLGTDILEPKPDKTKKSMILFYLILLVSTAFPNFMPSRVSQYNVTAVFCWIKVI